MLVCMDIHFPETARLLALDGVDVICHISNWLAERTPRPTGLAGQWKTVVICWRVTAGD